jgi:hypothetical protein
MLVDNPISFDYFKANFSHTIDFLNTATTTFENKNLNDSDACYRYYKTNVLRYQKILGFDPS